ncbi:MAG: hypothetical protein QM775_05200 [Pirellulales bacterium]
MDPRELAPETRPYLAADLIRRGSPEQVERDLAELVRSGRLSPVEADELRRGDVDRTAVGRYSQRVQSADAAIARAFGEVPVPAGSRERVLLAIAEQEAQDAAATPVELAGPRELVATDGATLPQRALLSRRGWLAACTSAAATTAAGVGFALWWQGRQRPELTKEDVLHQTLAFHRLPDSMREPTVPITETPAPADFPLSRAITSLCNVPRWRRLDGQLFGRLGAAYELAAPEEPRATIYVMQADVFGRAPLIASLPVEPVHAPENTNGASLGAWREEGRIVVFVVDGDAARYRSFLTAPREIA